MAHWEPETNLSSTRESHCHTQGRKVTEQKGGVLSQGLQLMWHFVFNY